jgi:heme exporter protein A
MTDALPARFDPVHVRAGGVTLSRGGRTLVKDLAFAAAPGDALVITGPNGSGKTTLLRAIAGFIRPDGGEIIVAPGENTQIAYLGHADGLKPNERVLDALGFWAGLQGAPAEAVEPVMRRMAVAHLAKRPAERCRRASGGGPRLRAWRCPMPGFGFWMNRPRRWTPAAGRAWPI